MAVLRGAPFAHLAPQLTRAPRRGGFNRAGLIKDALGLKLSCAYGEWYMPLSPRLAVANRCPTSTGWCSIDWPADVNNQPLQATPRQRCDRASPSSARAINGFGLQLQTLGLLWLRVDFLGVCVGRSRLQEAAAYYEGRRASSAFGRRLNSRESCCMEWVADAFAMFKCLHLPKVSASETF